MGKQYFKIRIGHNILYFPDFNLEDIRSKNIKIKSKKIKYIYNNTKKSL